MMSHLRTRAKIDRFLQAVKNSGASLRRTDEDICPDVVRGGLSSQGVQLRSTVGLTFSSSSLFLSLFLSFPNSSSWQSLPLASAAIQPAWYRRCSRLWWTLPEPRWGPLQPRRYPSLLPLPRAQAPLPGLWSPREPVPPRLARKALH